MTALDRLALAEFLEARESSAVVKRNARRDELAERFYGKHYTYTETPESTRKAIDAYIELEEAQA